MDQNKKWMARGKIGCTFAAYFASRPQLCNWITVVSPESFSIPAGAAILSMQFPGWDKAKVKEWALANGFYTEELGDGCTGLRYNVNCVVAWVQYFGPDSHVITRQAPIPELCMAVKLPAKYYWQVGYKNILHLAHASVGGLTQKMQDIFWNSSFDNTAKRLGKKPTVVEGAKTTYHE